MNDVSRQTATSACEGFNAYMRQLVAHVPKEVATWCDCGTAIVGFEGVIKCPDCGTLYSVSRMRIDVSNQGPKAASG